MKPNQEISLKFWIAMIIFFAIVLSIPLMNNLVEKSIINYADIAGFYFVCFVSALCFYMILVLRHSEVKTKLNELETKSKNEGFYRTVSAQTITDYDNQIKCQESKINELKTAFEDAVAEITELRLKDKNNFSYIQELISDKDKLKVQITYWKERALHQKHTKKVVNSEWYELIIDQDYLKEFFNTNKKYKISHINPPSDNLLYLIGNDDQHYLVYKKDFKPVQK